MPQPGMVNTVDTCSSTYLRPTAPLNLTMAVSLESLRMQLACLHGRLAEQEHALAQSARDIEHANAKQRRAQRQVEDSAARTELAEKQLEAARHEKSRAKERLDRQELAAIEAVDAHAAPRVLVGVCDCGTDLHPMELDAQSFYCGTP